MSTSHAAVMRAHDQPFTIEEIHLGDLRPNELRVKILAAGLCHTDLLGRIPQIADFLKPFVPGHEGAGIVEAIGNDVTTISVGDHVLLSFDSCGDCTLCRDGRPSYCATFNARNLSGRRDDHSVAATDSDGQSLNNRWFAQSSLATHAITTERNTIVVDHALPLDLLAPLGCGVQTGAGAVLNHFNLQPGETIAVFGVGAVGLAAIMAAKIAGAREIIAIDLHDARLELARELGATRTVRGDTESLAQVVAGEAPGLHYAFDTSGVPAVVRTAIASVRPGGAVALVGASTQELTLRSSDLTGISLTHLIEGSANPKTFVPQLITYWQAGQLPLEKLTRNYPLTDIAQAEADLATGDVVKAIMIPAHDGGQK